MITKQDNFGELAGNFVNFYKESEDNQWIQTYEFDETRIKIQFDHVYQNYTEAKADDFALTSTY